MSVIVERITDFINIANIANYAFGTNDFIVLLHINQI